MAAGGKWDATNSIQSVFAFSEVKTFLSFKMNSSHNEFSYDDSSLTTFEKVVLGIMLFLISIPGTVMLMILVQFDRIGGGYPLKRRITDH